MARRTHALTWYGIVFFGAMLLDRLTKLWAVSALEDTVIRVSRGVNFHLMWNRGVAGSFLSSSSTLGFVLLTGFIICMIATFAFFTFIRFHNNHSIFFETIVMAGALSNIVDRLVYGAVVDFIECYYHSWYWPTFNLADAFICVGVMGIVAISHWNSGHAGR